MATGQGTFKDQWVPGFMVYGMGFAIIIPKHDKLQYYSAGEEIEIEVARLNNGEYEESTVTVTLSARPDGNQ